jgi:hypothetical protein
VSLIAMNSSVYVISPDQFNLGTTQTPSSELGTSCRDRSRVRYSFGVWLDADAMRRIEVI